MTTGVWPRLNPRSLKDVCLFALERAFGRLCYSSIEDPSSKLVVRYLMENIVHNVPFRLADEICSRLKRVHVRFLMDASLSEHHKRLGLEITQSLVLNMEIRTLNLKSELMLLGNSVISMLHPLFQLRHLVLGYIADSEAEKMTVEALRFLPNLTLFSIHRCSDDILTSLTSHCQHLETVCLYEGRVTNSGVLGLNNSKFLRKLEIQRNEKYVDTSIATLLTDHPCLEDLEYDDLFGALKIVAGTESCHSVSKLKFLRAGISSRHLQLLNKVCPHLEQLRIVLKTGNDFNLPAKFPSLSVLDLWSWDFINESILPFFQVNEALFRVSIHVHGHISGQCMSIISKCCPNLEVLVLTVTLYNLDEDFQMSDFKDVIEFSSLRCLFINCGDLNKSLFSMQCPKLESVSLKSVIEVSYDKIKRFLDLNIESPLKNVLIHQRFCRDLGVQIVKDVLQIFENTLEDMSVDSSAENAIEIGALVSTARISYPHMDFEAVRISTRWTSTPIHRICCALKSTVQKAKSDIMVDIFKDEL